MIKTAPRKRCQVTIAISNRSVDGVILYADKKIIASDGATTEGTKIYRASLPNDGYIALASAANDAIASEALAVDLISRAKGEKDQKKIWGTIQSAMVNWSAPYPAGELPQIQYLMALRTFGQARIYLLQLRNQIVPVPSRRAIGAGGRIVDAMLEDVFPEGVPFDTKVSLFNMAYMARRAKDNESSVGGGSRSNAIYIPDEGIARWIDEDELWLAEELASTVDERLSATRRVVMSLGTFSNVQMVAESLKKWLVDESDSLKEKITFKSLEI